MRDDANSAQEERAYPYTRARARTHTTTTVRALGSKQFFTAKSTEN